MVEPKPKQTDAENTMTSQAWTPNDVEYLVVEAAETLQRCESVNPPVSAKPALWNEYVDKYGKERNRIKLVASSSALSRMEATWGLINELPNADIRKALYGWSMAGCRRGDSITKVARRHGVPRSTIYRRVRAGCSQIADNLNKKQAPILTMLQNRPKSVINSLHSKKYETRRNPRYWRAPGAKPVVTPEVRQQRALAAKAANQSRNSESRSGMTE